MNRRSFPALLLVAPIGVLLTIFCCNPPQPPSPPPAPPGSGIAFNDDYPIRDPSNLSPPYIGPANECASSVRISSIVPEATVQVYLNGAPLGLPVPSKYAFVAPTLPVVLKLHDRVSATQTYRGVTSDQTDPPMEVGTMPTSLPAPIVGTELYECGRVAVVRGVTPGAEVDVIDHTQADTQIGHGVTPNIWGEDWVPVATTALTRGHEIRARQFACNGVRSLEIGGPLVKPEPSPLPTPKRDAVVGNGTVMGGNLLVGAAIQVFYEPGSVRMDSCGGTCLATSKNTFVPVSPKVDTWMSVWVRQELCTSSQGTPEPPTTTLSPPVLRSICPGDRHVSVDGTTVNAFLVLLKNGAIVGYGGGAPGTARLNLSLHQDFRPLASVRVVEYIGSIVVSSNIVRVSCEGCVALCGDECCTPGRPNCVDQRCQLCPRGSVQCGSTCCPASTPHCLNGTCQQCPAGQLQCGSKCCAPGQNCTGGICCEPFGTLLCQQSAEGCCPGLQCINVPATGVRECCHSINPMTKTCD